jgi:hypothetical protein
VGVKKGRDVRVKLRTEDLSVRELDGELVVLDLRSSRYLSVTGVGVDIVKMLADERTEPELVAGLLGTFDIEEEVARRDTAAFVASLRDAGLLE